MPIFDYNCTCGEKKDDELVKNSDEIVICDYCGNRMKKGISAPNLGGFDKNGTSKSGKNGTKTDR